MALGIIGNVELIWITMEFWVPAFCYRARNVREPAGTDTGTGGAMETCALPIRVSKGQARGVEELQTLECEWIYRLFSPLRIATSPVGLSVELLSLRGRVVLRVSTTTAGRPHRLLLLSWSLHQYSLTKQSWLAPKSLSSCHKFRCQREGPQRWRMLKTCREESGRFVFPYLTSYINLTSWYLNRESSWIAWNMVALTS